MIRVTCNQCNKIVRNRTGNKECRKCRVLDGELNRPNRKQIGKQRKPNTRG